MPVSGYSQRIEAGIAYKLRGAETVVQVPRVHAHAFKLWVMLRLGDGWMGLMGASVPHPLLQLLEEVSAPGHILLQSPDVAQQWLMRNLGR